MKGTLVSLLVCFGILLSCSGCNPEKPKPESPLSTPAFQSPVAPAAAARQACLKLIEPKGNTVCGYIVGPDGSPVVNRPIFLAQGIFTSDNKAVFAALDQATAPKGITDKNGMFHVTDVASDLYFLMMDNYPAPVMLKERANPTNDLMIDWRKSGGALDLGVISAQP